MLRPDRSMLLRHVGVDMLLKTATKKHLSIAREEVGFKLSAPATSGDEDREKFTRTSLYLSFLSRVSL